jgi:hypothetical protein
MKTTTTFLIWVSILCAFFLTACSQLSYNFTPQLTNVPLVPHNNEVELYFGNEMPKNQVYYEVLGLSAEGNDYNAVLLQLKNNANRAGVDAIIHINNSQANYTSSEGGVYSSQVVKGVGIKYRDNLTYINQYIKNKQVYSLSDVDTSNNASALLYEAPFHMLGHEITNGKKINSTYTRHVRDLSFDFLLYDTFNWTYRINERKQVVERSYFTDPNQTQAYIVCAFKYNPGSELHSIKITYPTNPNRNVYMELVYSQDDTVLKKMIYDTPRKKNLLFVENLAYDRLNRIAQTTLYKVEQNRQIPFLQTVYNYYTMEDLPVPKNM